MNEELIMKMAAPSIKDGALTYALFDRIYSMLSLREQYQVCEILYKNNIEPELFTPVSVRRLTLGKH